MKRNVSTQKVSVKVTGQQKKDLERFGIDYNAKIKETLRNEAMTQHLIECYDLDYETIRSVFHKLVEQRKHWSDENWWSIETIAKKGDENGVEHEFRVETINFNLEALC
jgi:hypothetical protein